MSPHWLEFLKQFGPGAQTLGTELTPSDLTRLISTPRGQGRYDVLFEVFGPIAGSPWEPYHCPTLFAAIDRLKLTPRPLTRLPLYEATAPDGAFDWLATDTLVLVDLEGPESVQFGARLASEAAQLICTFDHWFKSPQDRTAPVCIDTADIVDAMAALADEVFQHTSRLPATVAPVWLCDRRRMGTNGRTPSPGVFDNRYYIDDSLLPGPHALKTHHIRRIVYVSPTSNAKPRADLGNFMADAHEKANVELYRLAIDAPQTLVNPTPMSAPFRVNIASSGFSRSSLGGFGKLIPIPSESSSYSSYGRGG